MSRLLSPVYTNPLFCFLVGKYQAISASMIGGNNYYAKVDSNGIKFVVVL